MVWLRNRSGLAQFPRFGPKVAFVYQGRFTGAALQLVVWIGGFGNEEGVPIYPLKEPGVQVF